MDEFQTYKLQDAEFAQTVLKEKNIELNRIIEEKTMRILELERELRKANSFIQYVNHICDGEGCYRP
jgi:hypothetical protein